MKIYRICLERWSDKLTSSGFPARWNSKGKYVLYTAGTRALACLENVVHRSGEGLNDNFKVMVIELPEEVKIKELAIEDLPDNWTDFASYSDCQKIGDAWIDSGEPLVLRVPSAIISQEFNYLFNVKHADMKRVKLIDIEDFVFDSRLKS